MEVWSFRLNKIGFLPSCRCVNTTVWMHYKDIDKMHREEARWELRKNDTYYFEQIQEVIAHKTAAGRPFTSHLKNLSNKMNKTCGTLLEKQEWTHKLLWTSTHGRTSFGWSARNYLHQVCADTGRSSEDQPRAMDDRDGWRERERERQGNPCSDCDLMMMIIYIYIYTYRYIFTYTYIHTHTHTEIYLPIVQFCRS